MISDCHRLTMMYMYSVSNTLATEKQLLSEKEKKKQLKNYPTQGSRE